MEWNLSYPKLQLTKGAITFASSIHYPYTA